MTTSLLTNIVSNPHLLNELSQFLKPTDISRVAFANKHLFQQVSNVVSKITQQMLNCGIHHDYNKHLVPPHLSQEQYIYVSVEHFNKIIIRDNLPFGYIHTLRLSNCQGITDVSALGYVHTLYLSDCHGITDVSALGNVHTLDLSGCQGITDVSALGNVHTLYLYSCERITDVSMLGNVPKLFC